MKKITKKEIKEFLKDIKKNYNNMGWKINKAGAYTKDGKIIFNINNPSPSGCQKDQKVSQDFFNNNQSDEGYLYGIVK